jgi:hypothetical protein
MKPTYLLLLCVLIIAGCETQTEEADNSSQALFEENSKTVMAYIEGFQNESLDYDSLYSDQFLLLPTGQYAPDSVTLDEMKEQDQKNWASLDFKLLTDPVVLLPGVSVKTKQPDGSVRYYGSWEVSVPGTDSTEAKSAIIKTYHSYDFDDNGKIAVQQLYGDFGGLLKVLFDDDDTEEDNSTEE